MQVIKAGWSLAILQTSNALSHLVDTSVLQCTDSPLFPMGNIRERLGIYGYKSEQPASWPRKVQWLSPSSLWDLDFLAIKPSLILNPSLSRGEERTTLSLTNKEVAMLPCSCQS